jgi:hypothetical protein
VEIYLSF